jgi:uncharacterized protein (DUF4415 family)
VAAAKQAASKVPSAKGPKIDWSQATVTRGGGVAAVVAAVRRTRGPNKRPAKEQVAIRLDQDVVGALRASGPGWQTRVNAALKEWLASQPAKRKSRRHSAA